jgi:hypothetical protein
MPFSNGICYIASNGRMIVNWKECERNWPWSILDITQNFREEAEESHENFS